MSFDLKESKPRFLRVSSRQTYFTLDFSFEGFFLYKKVETILDFLYLLYFKIFEILQKTTYTEKPSRHDYLTKCSLTFTASFITTVQQTIKDSYLCSIIFIIQLKTSILKWTVLQNTLLNIEGSKSYCLFLCR